VSWSLVATNRYLRDRKAKQIGARLVQHKLRYPHSNCNETKQLLFHPVVDISLASEQNEKPQSTANDS
jgi:hypothetical protein